MKVGQSVLSILEVTIKQAISKYTCGCEQSIVTDIHIQANQSTGEFTILDDEDKETITELLLMDDDTLLVNEELLKGLDEELDTFLKELLEK